MIGPSAAAPVAFTRRLPTAIDSTCPVELAVPVIVNELAPAHATVAWTESGLLSVGALVWSKVTVAPYAASRMATVMVKEPLGNSLGRVSEKAMLAAVADVPPRGTVTGPTTEALPAATGAATAKQSVATRTVAVPSTAALLRSVDLVIASGLRSPATRASTVSARGAAYSVRPG